MSVFFQGLGREKTSRPNKRNEGRSLQNHADESVCRKRRRQEIHIKRTGKNSDFQGCYVLGDENGPLYVGISRGVIQRLIQHVKGKNHFDASFSYRIASENYEHEMSRGDAMNHDEFKMYFSDAKAVMSVAFIEISNDLELYLF